MCACAMFPRDLPSACSRTILYFPQPTRTTAHHRNCIFLQSTWCAFWKHLQWFDGTWYFYDRTVLISESVLVIIVRRSIVVTKLTLLHCIKFNWSGIDAGNSSLLIMTCGFSIMKFPSLPSFNVLLVFELTWYLLTVNRIF